MTVNELGNWLEANGWKSARNPTPDKMNLCGWYAYRRTSLPARECECNDGRPLQIVVWPSRFVVNGNVWESAEVEVSGEASGRWYRLKAYSLHPREIPAALPEIEAALVRAWNAIIPELPHG